MLIICAVGCVFNVIGIAIANDSRYPFGAGWILYQMYYILIVSGLALLYAPIRHQLDRDKRAFHPTDNYWRGVSALLVMVLFAAVGGVTDLLHHGDSQTLSCKVQLFLGCFAALSYSIVVPLTVTTHPGYVAAAVPLMAILYIVFMGMTTCRDLSISGRLFRFLVWYGGGFAWGRRAAPPQ